jgi:hypothetical protein
MPNAQCQITIRYLFQTECTAQPNLHVAPVQPLCFPRSCKVVVTIALLAAVEFLPTLDFSTVAIGHLTTHKEQSLFLPSSYHP